MRPVLRGLEAVIGGVTVGERAWRGDHMRAAMMAATLVIPLLWKKRLLSVGLMAAAALLSYYLAEEFVEDEIVVEPISVPAGASMN